VRTRPLPLLAAILTSALLASCVAAGPSADPPASDGPAGPASDGRLTIADDVAGPALPVPDALARRGEAARVRGSLFVEGNGRMLLCEAIAESFPPQCGGRRLEVVGLDLATIAALQSANGVRWAEAVELSGTVD
jgi:hypothetical protein